MHPRNTYQSGASAMLASHSWHGSRSLDKVKVGDILRVRNGDTLEVVYWRVTEPAVRLSREEARQEWESLRFYEKGDPKPYRYFPYVLRNLVKVEGPPPK